ncbi:unnamed protein product [Diplocarpon coronariae]
MADDTMEISSEHGQDMEQEDIDIDLDLTAGNVDEDYILEDATSHINFGNEFHPQPSPIANDESMVDDDNVSYQMEDAELLNEGGEQTTEQESNTFTTLDEEPSPLGTNDPETGQYVSEGVGSHISIPCDDAVATDLEKSEFNLVHEGSEDILEHDDAQYPDEARRHSPETIKNDLAVQGSQTSTPSRHSSIPTAPAEPRSSPNSVTEILPGYPVTSPEQTQPDLSSGSPHSEDGFADISQLKNQLSNFGDVRVVYRSIEYDLFSSSELDDPDSYFLSDISMAEKPLSEFFRAMRDIINGDLADEDELWILVESLGLEAGETSSFLHEVNLKEILSLHAELLHNDGIESSGQICYIQLKTRMDFSRRFSNLTAGAAEGKGITAFGSWNGQSLCLNDTEHADESKYENDSNVGSNAFGDINENHGSQQEPGAPESKISGPGSHATSQEYELYQPENPQSDVEHIQEVDGPNSNRSSTHPIATTPGATTSQSLKVGVVLRSDVDEDGDLIDYSENEDDSVSRKAPNTADTRTPANGIYADFIEPCLSPEFCFCPKCADLMILGDEGEDQDYRRRSLSRVTTEDNLSRVSSGQYLLINTIGQENQNENTKEQWTGEGDQRESPKATGSGHDDLDQTDTGEYLENGDYSEENGYNRTNGEGYEYDGENSEQNQMTVAQGGTHDHEDQQEYEIVCESGSGDKESSPDNLVQDCTAEQGPNDESAIANYDNVELEFEGAEAGFEDTHLENLETNEIQDSQERFNANSLATIETMESSVTMSADADEIQYEDEHLEGDISKQDESKETASPKESLAPRVAVEYTDEIGYDDDDEEDTKNLSHSAAHVDAQFQVKGFANTKGKRSILDVDSSDSQTRQTKDAKRPRA